MNERTKYGHHSRGNEKFHVEETSRHITATSDNFSYTYDKATGCFSQMTYAGHTLLNRPMEYNIWRAPTDNDRKIKLQWLDAGYDRTTSRAYGTSWSMCHDENSSEHFLRISSTLALHASALQKIMDMEATWLITGTGAVTAYIHAKRNTAFPELPRFGLRLFLPEDMEDISYCGLGPVENYVDKRHAAYHGSFRTTVARLHEDYIRPQENGSRGDCDHLALSGDKLLLAVAGIDPFSFNASRYTQEELTAKAHNFELQACGSTVLCLDHRQNGIGSASCGPELMSQYKLIDETMDFGIHLIPEGKE